MRTVPPAGVWRSALSRRLVSTWPMRSGSTRTCASVLRSVSRVMPAAAKRSAEVCAASRARSAAATGCRAMSRVPSSARDTAEMSSASRRRRCVLSRITSRVSSSRVRMPSSIASRCASTVARGVRISWARSASIRRLDGLGGLQALGEGVAGRGQDRELPAQAGVVDPGVVLTGGHVLGSGGHLRDGTLDPAREVPGHRQGGGGGSDQRDRDRDRKRGGEGSLDVPRLGGGVRDARPAEVVTEDRRADDRGHDPGRHRPGEQHQRLGTEQTRPETGPTTCATAHSPVPIR